MPNTYLFALSFIAIGALTVVLGVMLGAWIMFKGKSRPGTGENFLKDPKGDVFTVSDGLDEAMLPGSEEPSLDEKNLLKKTERFLETLGGGE